MVPPVRSEWTPHCLPIFCVERALSWFFSLSFFCGEGLGVCGSWAFGKDSRIGGNTSASECLSHSEPFYEATLLELHPLGILAAHANQTFRRRQTTRQKSESRPTSCNTMCVVDSGRNVVLLPGSLSTAYHGHRNSYPVNECCKDDACSSLGGSSVALKACCGAEQLWDSWWGVAGPRGLFMPAACGSCK